MKLVAVAVPAPLRRLFDYAAGDAESPSLLPGMRVRVPFGRRQAVGVVVELPREEAQPAHACKPIDAVLDAEPLLPAELLELCVRVADYYHHPLGEVFAAALPGPLRRGAPCAAPAADGVLRLTPAGVAALPGLPARATVLRALLERLHATPEPRASLARGLPRSAAALRQALARGWLELAPPPAAVAEAGLQELPPTLTAEQAAALAQLRAMPAGYGAALVEGVTGSGKTELYLRLAADALEQGGQVLVLAPEIGLTPQLAQRFARRFGARVASYHSGLSEAARAEVWRRARAGEVAIVVGTRSAVFVPLARPRLIIVDEEHDVSYKQQESLRYNARDVALLRAQRLGVVAVLGSATPALESLHNAAAGRYLHLRLQARVHSAAAPRIGVVDVRGQRLEHGLSAPLLDAVERHLGAGGQALLFINRRGFAPTLLCQHCGWVARCARCDARMVVHRGRARLLCHHCGSLAPLPAACPDCGQGGLLPLGQGTERIEDALRLRFPQRRIERFDSDRLLRAGELERLLADVREGRVQVLVGTQVLAKGHDFAGLSLAGIVDVDQALFGSDFRALERMGQMVTQVAGRVGRSCQPGEVLLQTLQPDHPLLRRLIERGYPEFCRALLDERRAFGLPPFSRLALLRAEAPREGAAMEFLRRAAAAFGGSGGGVDLLGPAPAAMERRGGLHRAQLLLRSARRAPLHRRLAAWMPLLEELRSRQRVRWSLDVDPADLF